MNDRGEGCYPSIEQQSEDTSLSVRAIKSSIKEAENAGLVTKELHGFKGKGWRRNEYKACYPNYINMGFDTNHSAPNAPRNKKNIVQELHHEYNNGSAPNAPSNDSMMVQIMHHDNHKEVQELHHENDMVVQLVPFGSAPNAPSIYSINSPKNSPNIINDDYSASASVDKNSIQNIFRWLENHFSAPGIFYISAPIEAWISWGADFEKDIKPVAEAYKIKNSDKPPNSLTFLNDRIAASIRQRNKPMPVVAEKSEKVQGEKKPYLSQAVYIVIKNKIKEGYTFVSPEEREYIRAFEKQEISKLSQ